MLKYHTSKVTLLFLFLSIILSTLEVSADSIYLFCHNGINRISWNSDGTLLAAQGFRGVQVFDRNLTLLNYLEDPVVPQTLGVGGVTETDEFTAKCWGHGVSWHPGTNDITMPIRSQETPYATNKWLETRNATTNSIVQTFAMSIWQADQIADIEWHKSGMYVASVLGTPLIDDGVSPLGRAWWIVIIPSSGFENAFTLDAEEETITSISWNPENYWLAASTQSGTVYLWDINDKEIAMSPRRQLEQGVLRIFQIHSNDIHDITWHPNGELIATADDAGTIFIWQAENGEIFKELKVDNNAVQALDWNSSGTLLASAGDDAVARIWDVTSGEVIKTFEGHDAEIIDLDWNPTDDLIATVSLDDTIRVWEVNLPDIQQ